MHSKPFSTSIRIVVVSAFLITSVVLLLLSTAFRGIASPTTGLAAPQISGIAPATVQRSGIIRIMGSGFGEQQGGSVLQIDAKPSTFVAYWTDTSIVAHVPETASTGNVTVSVTTAEGTAMTSVVVTIRQPSGRIRWRAEAVGDYILGRVAVAPPNVPGAGTIYAGTNAGFLYAWTPNGALKWAVPGTTGDDPVSVGLDGTIYTASAEPDARGVVGAAVNAFNPDGSRKWTFADGDSQSVRAGPSVGPDGKIYVIFRSMVDVNGNPIGLNFAALRPDGTLAWSVNRDFHRYGADGKELTFGRQLPHVYFAFDVFPDPSPGFVNGGTFAYDFNGRLVWEKPGGCCGVMAIPPDEGVRHYGARLDPLTGQTVYSFNYPPYGATPNGAPDAGPDNVHYIKGNSRLFAINPSGSEKWHYDPLLPDGSYIPTNSPIVNPTNTTILLGGGGSFGQQSVFLAVAPKTGQELWRQPLPFDPSFPPYGNIFFPGRATFSADGNTGYLAGDINGDQDFLFQEKYCYLYALNTGPENIPVNQAPQAFITSPTEGFEVAKNTRVNITADVQDDGEVAKVDFYYNYRGTINFISSDSTAPYSATFQSANPDVYGIYAVATDAGGLTAQSAVVGIIVTNRSPNISWVSPNSGSQFLTSSIIVLKVAASDADGRITNVEFNSNLVGPIGQDSTADADGTYTINFVNPPEGTHELYAWATDDNGYRQSAIITIVVGPAPTPTPTPSPTVTPTPTPTPTPTRIKPVKRKSGQIRTTAGESVSAVSGSEQSGPGREVFVVSPFIANTAPIGTTSADQPRVKSKRVRVKCQPGTVRNGKRCEPVPRK
jgi:hypothetical protein